MASAAPSVEDNYAAALNQFYRLFRSLERIPDAMLGQNIFWICGIGFDLVSQIRNVNAQVFRLAAVFGSPNFAEQIRVQHDASGVPHQLRE